MKRRSGSRWAICAVAAVCALSAAPAAQARDFFQALFGGAFSDNPSLAPARPEPVRPESAGRLPFANEGEVIGHPVQARPRVSDEGASSGGNQAFCVRTCDGRYFPISTGGNQSSAASCHSFCPASETKVVYGGSIEHAATERGKPYSALPNAFRYRDELVSGCTCNGKDAVGLAQIKIEDDPTLRKGDIVAGANGLVVASRVSEKPGAVNFSPASASLRAKYQRVPVVAAE